MITKAMVERASQSQEAFLEEIKSLSEEEIIRLDYLCMVSNPQGYLKMVASKNLNRLIKW